MAGLEKGDGWPSREREKVKMWRGSTEVVFSVAAH